MTDDVFHSDLPDLTGLTLREVRALDPDNDPLLRAALDRIERETLRGPQIEWCSWSTPGPM